MIRIQFKIQWMTWATLFSRIFRQSLLFEEFFSVVELKVLAPFLTMSMSKKNCQKSSTKR